MVLNLSEFGWWGLRHEGPTQAGLHCVLNELDDLSSVLSISCHLCFQQAGVLLGIAIRTGSPLSLSLAEPVWKQLAGMSLTIADLSEVTAGRQ